MSQKHIVIDKNTIDITESNTIDKFLTVDWGNKPLGVSCPKSNNGFFSIGSNPTVCPFRNGWRRPWDDLDMKELYNMNYHITINPDPLNQLDNDVYSKKLMFKIFRQFLLELKNKKYYKNIISVYEYGEKGKKYGKLHFHILFKTHCCNKIKEVACKYFGSHSKKRHRNTVVVKRITIDKSLNSDEYTVEQKVENYRSQCDYLLHKYMKKESQNRVKCLYSNLVKKI